jgi:hypothetical protein
MPDTSTPRREKQANLLNIVGSSPDGIIFLT